MTEPSLLPDDLVPCLSRLEQQGVYGSTLAAMAEGVQVWDGEGRLRFCNPVTLAQFGLESDPVALHYSALVGSCTDPEGKALINAAFPVARVLAGEGRVTGVVMRSHADRGRWLGLSAYPVADADGGLQAVLSLSHDLGEAIETRRDLERQAHFDPLTGLPNRSLLSHFMTQAMSLARRTGDKLAICLLDLDGFKPVNDNLGHSAGDQLLQMLAERLQQALREEDDVVRLGGDEFVLLLGGLKSDGDFELVMSRLLTTVAKPYPIAGRQVQVTASIGVTLFPDDDAIDDQLLRHADHAMYGAKEQGKNQYLLFDPTLASRLRANRGVLQRISKALEAEQFVLYYQPQVDCTTGRVVGVEALIRWNHPVLGLRPPGEFLPLIENEDLAIRLGEWVLETALKQLARWRAEGLELTLGVNISGRQILYGHFDRFLDRMLETYPPELMRCLEIEILETAALEDMKAIGRLMVRYQDRGIRFALDDFGTGFSSLAHLKHLSVNVLKIDRSFVDDMLTDPSDMAIVQGVIGLCRAFGYGIVAEGVECIDQVLMLLELGCKVMQGYELSRPMPADQVRDWVEHFHQNPLWRLAGGDYPSRVEFDLLLMEVGHRHWQEQVSQVVNHVGSLRQPPADYESCRLTHWYTGRGLEMYGDDPAFHDLDRMHRQLHLEGEKLLRRGLESPGGERMMERFLLSSYSLIDALRRFRINRGRN